MAIRIRIRTNRFRIDFLSFRKFEFAESNIRTPLTCSCQCQCKSSAKSKMIGVTNVSNSVSADNLNKIGPIHPRGWDSSSLSPRRELGSYPDPSSTYLDPWTSGFAGWHTGRPVLGLVYWNSILDPWKSGILGWISGSPIFRMDHWKSRFLKWIPPAPKWIIRNLFPEQDETEKKPPLPSDW
jgi:hypothetical protein